MKPNDWIICGAVVAGLAVAAGAFGAHGLKTYLVRENMSDQEESDVEHRLEIHETAARYQMYHGLALILVGLVATRTAGPAVMVAGWSFLLGVVIFCGCLYGLVLAGPRILGAVVPIGGVGFIIGWVALAVAAWQTRRMA